MGRYPENYKRIQAEISNMLGNDLLFIFRKNVAVTDYLGFEKVWLIFLVKYFPIDDPKNKNSITGWKPLAVSVAQKP